MRPPLLMALGGICLLLGTPGCGAADRPRAAPLSAAQHLDRARRNEAEARAHAERAGAARHYEASLGGRPACVDTLTSVPPPQSGGEPLRVARPCFVAHERASALQAEEAARHLDVARSHRAHATALREAEARACQGIGDSEREHSPFFHREDIRSVEPLLENHQVRGARILFRPVPGLTFDWMRRAVACHLARAAAMGYSTTEMPYCPLMLEGVSAAIAEEADGIVVLLRARRPEIARAILGRAEDLVLPPAE